MKKIKIIAPILILLILIVGMGSISAADNLDNDTFSTQNTETSAVGVLQSQNDESILGETITIKFDPKNPNDVLEPRITNNITQANAGDTIIIQGSPVHCHLTIDKQLTVIGEETGTIDPCPHHTHIENVMKEHGVFYVTEGGSGSVIQGFTFVNNDKAETPFAILVDGASDVTIKDCTIDPALNKPNIEVDKYVGIIIKNSNNIKLSNLFINGTINGLTIINSTNVEIIDSIFSFNENQAISVSDDSKNITIKSNSILNNGNAGIRLTSVNNVNILNNLIKDNGLNNKDKTGSGIYVNCNITKLTVKGNIFLSNALHAIMYDYRTRNLNNEEGADNLTVIDNNYFEGHSDMTLHHRTYVERDYGTIKYDAKNDVFGDVGEGNYEEGKSNVYLQHALVYHETLCGFTYYTINIPWTLDAPGNKEKYDLYLKLKLEQTKNGIYKFSIVDADGNVAEDFNSVNITFFLNNYSTVKPKEGDVYKVVSIQNGVAIADFRDEYNSFKDSGNVITAVFPGLSNDVDTSLNVKFNVNDADIPIEPSTKLIASKLTTYPLSDAYYSVKLVNSKGKAIAYQKITIKFNGKPTTVKTDKNGIAKVKVSLTTKKTYSVSVSYAGSDDYSASKLTSSIVVKTGTKKSKIKASNLKIKKNKKKTYQFKLTDSSGKALKTQKVTVKLNGKTYSLKTNSKGIAKLSVKLSKVKKYKISIKFLGNANYKAVSKTTTVTVTK